eukprot:GHRR01028600.1.p1 GENE.GHRR01028600.1~~GHRR01028600.1.p1  ORF type:complete len:137 (-),score=5.60 GHRR01028600.1:18-428(-)
MNPFLHLMFSRLRLATSGSEQLCSPVSLNALSKRCLATRSRMTASPNSQLGRYVRVRSLILDFWQSPPDATRSKFSTLLQGAEASPSSQDSSMDAEQQLNVDGSQSKPTFAGWFAKCRCARSVTGTRVARIGHAYG